MYTITLPITGSRGPNPIYANALDDDAKIISKRQDVYWNQTAPIIDHYKKVNLLKEINGLGSIEEVTQRIIKVINL